ncbi:MAG: hypothetical protein JWN49_642 [Parcubacteria group bacterium]|nr:hypothetical protein [Parcubacteria group bacterium]
MTDVIAAQQSTFTYSPELGATILKYFLEAIYQQMDHAQLLENYKGEIDFKTAPIHGADNPDKEFICELLSGLPVNNEEFLQLFRKRFSADLIRIVRGELSDEHIRAYF